MTDLILTVYQANPIPHPSKFQIIHLDLSNYSMYTFKPEEKFKHSNTVTFTKFKLIFFCTYFSPLPENLWYWKVKENKVLMTQTNSSKVETSPKKHCEYKPVSFLNYSLFVVCGILWCCLQTDQQISGRQSCCFCNLNESYAFNHYLIQTFIYQMQHSYLNSEKGCIYWISVWCVKCPKYWALPVEQSFHFHLMLCLMANHDLAVTSNSVPYI